MVVLLFREHLLRFVEHALVIGFVAIPVTVNAPIVARSQRFLCRGATIIWSLGWN